MRIKTHSRELPLKRAWIGKLIADCSERFTLQLHHIGWAVRSASDSYKLFHTQLGLPHESTEDIGDLKVAFYTAGETLIELLEPLAKTDDIAVFIKERGEGIHHLAYEVDSVVDALAAAKKAGLKLLDEEPRPGARGTMIGFVDPETEDGVLVEYVEVPK